MGAPAAVEQDDRPPAARALRLLAKLGQQIVDRADAVSADIGRPQLLIGRDVPDHCAPEPAARLDDDRIARIDGVLCHLFVALGALYPRGWRRLLRARDRKRTRL